MEYKCWEILKFIRCINMTIRVVEMGEQCMLKCTQFFMQTKYQTYPCTIILINIL